MTLAHNLSIPHLKCTSVLYTPQKKFVPYIESNSCATFATKVHILTDTVYVWHPGFPEGGGYQVHGPAAQRGFSGGC